MKEIMSRKTDLRRKALFLSYFTVGYNILEGLASLTAGFFSGSIALTGFGLDSFVESLSGMIMIWRFRKHGTLTIEEEEQTEQKAVRLIGYTFFIFGAYVFIESVRKLYVQSKPEPSIPGIVIAVLSLIIMPILYHQKFTTAREIGSRSLLADSKETLACIMLSAALLLGLGMNYIFGIWWADPVTGLVIVFFLIREGLEIFEDEDDDD